MTGKRLTARPKRLVYRSVLLVVLVCALTLSAVAWFVMNKMSRTKDLEVVMPPIIYIRDDKREVMTSFDLDGLQINENYYALFCVAPAYKGVVEDFQVGVLYTENIGMIIDLFPVDNITGTQVDGKKYEERLLQDTPCFFNYTETGTAQSVTYSNSESPNENELKENLNRGVHKMYDGQFVKQKDTYPGVLEDLNDTEAYRFYVLRVTWKKDISAAELEKEADVVYIVTKGGTGGSGQTQ